MLVLLGQPDLVMLRVLDTFIKYIFLWRQQSKVPSRDYFVCPFLCHTLFLLVPDVFFGTLVKKIVKQLLLTNWQYTCISGMNRYR